MEKNTNPIKHYQKIEILNFSYNTLISLSIIVYGFMVTFSEVKDKQNANLVIGIFIGSLLGRLINTQLGIGKTDGSKPVINNSDTKSST